MRVWATLLLVMLAVPVWAETPGPAEAARAAADRLSAASQMLDEAKGANNRVKALTETIRAYEDGLQAMRDGLRRAAIREKALTGQLQARNHEISRLLGVLQGMGQVPAPVLLLHPAGPLGTARSGMIVSEIAPALTAQTQKLKEDLQEVSVLRALQQSAANKLQEGLEGAQAARTALSQAIADRTDLPRKFTEDPVKTALLVASTETLEGFASGLNVIVTNEVPGGLSDISARKGELPLPVQGRILRRAGESDAAGIVRPGVVIATRPRAIVTTPAAATIRYRGPLLDYGNVIILEPQAGILLVLAGLDVVYGDIGEVLPGGSPVGLMGGPDMDAGTLLAQNNDRAGAEQTETLYIELRQDNTPVNPEEWFKTDEG